jgi:hypothetical protein
MKKLLAVLALALFLGGISATAIAATRPETVAVTQGEEEKKSEQKTKATKTEATAKSDECAKHDEAKKESSSKSEGECKK